MEVYLSVWAGYNMMTFQDIPLFLHPYSWLNKDFIIMYAKEWSSP